MSMLQNIAMRNRLDIAWLALHSIAGGRFDETSKRLPLPVRSMEAAKGIGSTIFGSQWTQLVLLYVRSMYKQGHTEYVE